MHHMIGEIIVDESNAASSPEGFGSIVRFAEPAFLTHSSWQALQDPDSDIHKAVARFVRERMSAVDIFEKEIAMNAVPLTLYASKNDLNILYSNSQTIRGTHVELRDCSSSSDSIQGLFERHSASHSACMSDLCTLLSAEGK